MGEIPLGDLNISAAVQWLKDDRSVVWIRHMSEFLKSDLFFLSGLRIPTAPQLSKKLALHWTTVEQLSSAVPALRLSFS
jgi:hypothetical protein